MCAEGGYACYEYLQNTKFNPPLPTREYYDLPSSLVCSHLLLPCTKYSDWNMYHWTGDFCWYLEARCCILQPYANTSVWAIWGAACSHKYQYLSAYSVDNRDNTRQNVPCYHLINYSPTNCSQLTLMDVSCVMCHVSVFVNFFCKSVKPYTLTARIPDVLLNGLVKVRKYTKNLNRAQRSEPVAHMEEDVQI